MTDDVTENAAAKRAEKGNDSVPAPRAGAARKPSLTILLSAPRGFCAGVERAIQIVELALEKYGGPVYVRHEIVHNLHVVKRLEKLGAVFVEELDEVPDGAPVIFSAHGVPKSVPEEAKRRRLFFLDATCPLVSKVHVEAERHYRRGLEIVLIGHAGHPEVIGTMGQLPAGAIHLIESPEDAHAFEPRDPDKVAFITQTTLSVDDTQEIVDILKRRFPSISHPHKEDICYATTNRQAAVKEVAPHCDAMLVVGAPNSSNSVRLVEVAHQAGAAKAFLVQRASDIPWEELDGARTLGLTAGASAPECIVREVIEAFEDRFQVRMREVPVTSEDIQFKLPRALTA